MEGLFNLTWLIPVFPLVAFATIVLYVRRWKNISSYLAVGAIALSFVVSQIVFWMAISTPHLAEAPFHSVIRWMNTGQTLLQMGVMVDPLTAVMLFMVPLVCTMIFVYAIGYMHGDPRYSRFFAYICLFASGMLGLVVADNLLMLFMFWEVMGLCSYLLIGFWFEKPSAMKAGLKAFLTTRVGDAFFLMGLVLLYGQTGSLAFDKVLSPATLQTLANTMLTVPFFGAVPAATVIALLIFGGTVGKSAQFPLHIWLPDAMEGPTPVSALIHAATMVSAGVYLVVRMFPLFHAVPHGSAPEVVTFIGAFTALFASTIAVAQNDIKKVLAYSTISQLGYMVMALGLGAYVAGAFHLITHAFFKALLFMGSGSVIVGAHHEQDMMEMGGLRSRMKITFWTYIVGTLALAGIPPLAGFWSKDEILADAFGHGHILAWAVGSAAAFLTAFYMGRQIFLVFFGKPRSHHAEHAKETPKTMVYPLIVLAFFAALLGFVGVPEDFPVLGHLLGNPFHAFVGEAYAPGHVNWLVMGLSILLASGGLGLGYLLYGRTPLVAGQPDPLARLGPVYKLLKNKYYCDEIYHLIFIRPVTWLGDVMAVVDKNGLDWVVNTVGRSTAAFGTALWRFVDVPIIDGAVNLVGRSGDVFSRLWGWFDNAIIDGAVNAVGAATSWLGRELRSMQTGRVQNYLLIASVNVVVLVLLYMLL
ncbi:MAG TPA: NADH-quinone oxidoreductase subunit L [Anaerolineae bacterium]|nr:NADH-quinone oxidoreductase subunit L [Anaerolineae bacterium]HPL27953.1 NADH-quinone oxidoreductase subunit L [Anaerolineae bacterium]